MEIQIDLEKLRERKLFLGVPMYGGMCLGSFSKSIADLSAMCKEYGIPLHVYYLFNESLIPRARNYIFDEFMRSESQHLMFIDADIGFSAQDVIALMALQSDDSNAYDIIGGAYPKKNISWEKIKVAVDKGLADDNPEILSKFVGDYVFNPKNDGPIPLDQPSEVLEIGTGFMMIRKSSAQKYIDFYPENLYRPDHVRTEHFDGSRLIHMAFQAAIDRFDPSKIYQEALEKIRDGSDKTPFEIAIKVLEEAKTKIEMSSNRYLSEDYYFCQRAHQAGLKTWLCPWIQLNHTGSMTFGGSLIDIASLGVSATADVSVLKKGEK